MNNRMNFKEVEKLSAYLDGKLPKADVTRLESRLAQDPELRTVFDDLRRTRAVLRAAPKRRAPRNFTLKAQGQHVRPPIPRSFPVLRFASIVATLLLVFTFATNYVVPMSANRTPQPLYGYGGGGGGGNDTEMQANTEPGAPSAEMPAEPTPTNAPELAAPPAPAPTEEPPTLKSSAVESATEEATPDERVTGGAPQPEPAQEPTQAPPIAPVWQVSLLVVAVVLAILAYGLRWLNDHRWQQHE